MKTATIIDPVTGWFDITQYNDNKAMKIENLVETMWLIRYPWTVETTYDRGGVFLSHKFNIGLIKEEYGTKTKPDSSGNTQANVTI